MHSDNDMCGSVVPNKIQTVSFMTNHHTTIVNEPLHTSNLFNKVMYCYGACYCTYILSIIYGQPSELVYINIGMLDSYKGMMIYLKKKHT